MSLNWTSHHQAPDIRLENVHLGYSSHTVLHEISALLPGNRISVILGGSGGGKSTLLKTILGLLPPTSGRILLGEADLYALDPHDVREIRKRMGVLFQDGALLGSLPLDLRIREQADGGKPTVVAEPAGANAQAYRAIARRTAARLSLQAKNKQIGFPGIVIKDA